MAQISFSTFAPSSWWKGLKERGGSSGSNLVFSLQILKIFNYSLQSLELISDIKKDSEPLRFTPVLSVLNTSKMVMECMQVPDKVQGAFATAVKLKELYEEKESSSEKRGQLFETVTLITSLIRKCLSIFTKIFIRPVSYIQKQFKTGDAGGAFQRATQILSLVSGIIRVLDVAGKIAQEKKIIKNTIGLILDGADCVLKSLRLAKVSIHPAVQLALISGKSLFTLYKVWETTA